MSRTHASTVTRVVLTSFAAGVGAMALVGLVAPIAMKGGLSLTDAAAMTGEAPQQLIEPLDVAAIEADLARANTAMQEMRARTDDEIAQLERLSR